MGNWRGGTAAESHRSLNGTMSVKYVAELKTIEVLRILFPKLNIHFSPFTKEDEDFYKKTGFPRPNPHFPPLTDPLYHFRRWGQGTENFIKDEI